MGGLDGVEKPKIEFPVIYECPVCGVTEVQWSKTYHRDHIKKKCLDCLKKEEQNKPRVRTCARCGRTYTCIGDPALDSPYCDRSACGQMGRW
ncbi:MAG TPA: hypothetical protein ENH85_07090 [Candidatus Scalindua sp.]|nr:hypothetical protein [Candidatus Scalindua sp.]